VCAGAELRSPYGRTDRDAFCHGAFFGLGAVVAAEACRRRKGAGYRAHVHGLTLANVLGVPFGTAIGQAAGWRRPFCGRRHRRRRRRGALRLAGRAALLERGGLMQEARTLGRAQVLLAMLISVLASASLFSVSPTSRRFCERVSGDSPHQVTWVLLLLGLGADDWETWWADGWRTGG